MKGLSEMDKDAIKAKAYELLKENNMSGVTDIDVVRLARNLRFVVVTLNFKNGEEGFIIINNIKDKILGVKTKRMIGIEDRLDLPKKRFVIAHELGHYKLNYDGQEIFAKRDSTHGRNAGENDVDYFAACLLMPEDVFIREYEKIKKEISGESDNEKRYKIAANLGEIFTVPDLSALRRMDELDLKG